MNPKLDFPPTSKQEWLHKIKSDLKGKPVDDLFWNISDELRINPFVDGSDFSQIPQPVIDKSQNLWKIVEPIELKNEVRSENKILITALEQGANALSLSLNHKVDADYFDRLFNGVFLNLIHTEFIFSQRAMIESVMAEFVNYLVRTGYNLQEINGATGYTEGQCFYPDLNHDLPLFQSLCINAAPFYQGFEKVDLEIAHILNLISNQLQDLDNKLLSSSTDIYITILMDDVYLLNIAKIRALKKTTHLVLEAYGLERNLTVRIKAKIDSNALCENVNTNRIKASSIALATVIGGADSIELYQPGLAEKDQSEEYNRRIVRNISHILAMESYLDRVVDPSSGSYYIEMLTDTIAKRAWQKFQQMSAA